jgi:hypothetical protein
MVYHKITFVVSADINMDSVGIREDEKIQAIINIFRGHCQRLEGELDLLDLPHEVKGTFFDSDNKPFNIGFK